MKFGLVVQAALRESRGARGRLLFFTACLALGVAAIVGVASLITAIEDGLRAQSRDLLAADVSVDSRRALPKELDTFFADRPGAERTDVEELATMSSAKKTGKSKLVEAKAIHGRFPFYGAIGLEPKGDFGALLTNDTAIVAPEVLDALAITVGDDITIGQASFRIAAIVTEEPGRLDFALTVGPRVFLTHEGLARAKLDEFGARIRRRALFALPNDPSREELTAIKKKLEASLPDAAYLNVETHADAQPTLRRAMQRVERYLGLAALLSLILGGTGVAMIVRAWIASRTAGIAILRCLGFRPREILVLYAGNVVLFALVGSILGGLLGSFVPLVLPKLMTGLLPANFVLAWEPSPILRGVVLGIAIALVFSIPPLTAIWRVPPARVLRNEAEPLPPNRWAQFASFALLASGVFASAWYQSRSLVLAASFTGGVAALSALLALGAYALRLLAAKIPRERLNPYLLHGIAALGRPNAGTTGAVVALGLGVLVIVSMMLIESRLSERLRTALPADSPSIFLIDVQPDQWAGVRAELEAEGGTAIRDVPVVTARLTSVDGLDIAQLAERRKQDDDPERQTWMLTREQRITWMKELPKDNTILEGSLWSDPKLAEVSLEEQFARDLGAHLGSKLVFDLQGFPIELTVTSLRRVEWESFGINFFLVAEPGALDAAPHFQLGAARLPAENEIKAQDRLAEKFPNITLIRIRSILDKVLTVLGRLAVGVRILGSFTIATGIVILCGVVSSSTVHRAREVALLKTLGLRRAGVTALFATEFALVGFVAGLIGSLAALVLAALFLSKIVELDAALPWWVPFVAACASAALAAVCGVLACAPALATRPIESLRA